MIRAIALMASLMLPWTVLGQGAEPASAPIDRAAVGAEGAVPPLPEDGATIVECYDAAVANLEKVCEDYRRIKALELSKIRDIAFLDAYENIQPVMPILKPINRELLRKRITDPDEITAHKREVEKVESEVANMVELVTRLLLEIEASTAKVVEHQSTDSEPITLAEIIESPEYDPEEVQDEQVDPTTATSPQEQQLREKAKEKPQQRAVDLTAEMRALEKRVPEKIVSSSMSEAGIGSAMAPLPNMSLDVGRRLVEEGGSPVEWMFVDTWYTIGPFPNPNRINLNKKFPPETVVNLSATYRGKDDRIVGWEFLQTNEVRCTPLHDEEYAIYYAYTELWFDQATELWITIGSDDKANVWVNGRPVWISGDQLKSWNYREGQRKVHFRQGVNKVLYRVENGWKGTSFSLGIQVMK